MAREEERQEERRVAFVGGKMEDPNSSLYGQSWKQPKESEVEGRMRLQKRTWGVRRWRDEKVVDGEGDC